MEEKRDMISAGGWWLALITWEVGIKGLSPILSPLDSL